jgi:hypothetical protein
MPGSSRSERITTTARICWAIRKSGGTIYKVYGFEAKDEWSGGLRMRV